MKKGSYFQGVFRRLLPRLGYQSAIWAIAHRLCRLVWKILHEGVRFIERDCEVDPRAKKQRAQTLVRALRKLGYQVTITPLNQVTATNAIHEAGIFDGVLYGVLRGIILRSVLRLPPDDFLCEEACSERAALLSHDPTLVVIFQTADSEEAVKRVSRSCDREGKARVKRGAMIVPTKGRIEWFLTRGDFNVHEIACGGVKSCQCKLVSHLVDVLCACDFLQLEHRSYAWLAASRRGAIIQSEVFNRGIQCLSVRFARKHDQRTVASLFYDF